jgi:hypothetical protein
MRADTAAEQSIPGKPESHTPARERRPCLDRHPDRAAVRSLDSTTGAVRSDGRWDNRAAGIKLFEKAVRPLTEDEKIALELDVERMTPNPSEA